ncbi:MAG: hypothetical protein K0U98_21110 [Deltaproteobacteria bacterium]|nr:hypothetical protein [Deltaproteobacteria bacterium]
MKKNYLVKSAVALCLLASFALFGANAEARDTEPDTENCFYAYLTAYCNSHWSTRCPDGTYDESCRHWVLGPSTGWASDGGANMQSCSEALHALTIQAAYAGCTYQNPRCRQENANCDGEDFPDGQNPG